ncbi:MAG: ABC transporter ATP-binding protein [Candidatus Eisenbacteria bacterium]|nr:ABC transporter ATP-binding protein [Candidatus Eisenbacteria bacterium]
MDPQGHAWARKSRSRAPARRSAGPAGAERRRQDLKPSGGSAWLLGESIDTPACRRSLGFLPEQPYFYDFLSGVEYLEMAGRLSGLGARDAHRAAREWIGRVGLGERPSLRLRRYSKGMLQRLGLAAALVHRPQLLILDEPMSGLDPFGRRDVRDLILEQKSNGVSVLFSSHILPDVELLCDRVAILFGGRLSRLATASEVMQAGNLRIEIACAGLATADLPSAWNGLLRREERADGSLLTLEDEELLNEVLAWVLRSGAVVRSVTPQRTSLEDLFLGATERAIGLADQRRSA